MEQIKKILKNRNILLAIAIFQTIVVFDIATVFYILMVESSVYLTGGVSTMGEIAMVLAAVAITTLILNTFYIVLSFSRIRTWVLFLLIGILTVLFFVFMVWGAGSAFVSGLGILLIGPFFGFWYSTIFYGPAIFAYFRFRSPYISLGWLTLFFFSSLMVATATQIEAGGSAAATALLRPDYLVISAIFLFLVFLLLIIDNSSALARWKQTPEKPIKLPFFKTLVPVIAVLLMVTLCTNIISPVIWNVLWEETEASQVQPDDIPQDTNDGDSGNMDQKPNKVKMDPDQKLQDSINQNSKGKPNILFTVQVPEESRKSLDQNQRFYWKMENMHQFDQKNGFHNDMNYTSDFGFTIDNASFFQYMYLTDAPTLSNSKQLDQLYVFFDLETHWIIGQENQDSIRILNGPSRKMFEMDNSSFTVQKNRPWKEGESYELQSWMTSLNKDNKKDADILKLTNTKNDSILLASPEYTQIQLPDDKIKALTDDIVIDAESDFEKVMLIENYLLNNYTYTLNPGKPNTITPKTESMDRLNYFIFDSKKGYCLYFASAMTAMLRTQDIPSRVVGGFGQGIYDEELDSYIVTSNDAHAWVEVYFGQYGWITFDPTPPDPNQSDDDQNTKEQLTKEVRSRLDDMQEKAKNQKEKFDESPNEFTPDTTNNFETPEWLQNLMETIATLLMGLMELLKLLLPVCCVMLVIAGATMPPIGNYLYEEYLSGSFRSRTYRQQIIDLFRLIEFKARKMNGKYKRTKTETSLEYLDRIKKIPSSEEIVEDFKTACEIYNRAVFRQDLLPEDLNNMHTKTSKVLNWIAKNTPGSKAIASYWSM